MEKINRVRNLIIGGGLSGLSAAYYLGDDYLIIEKEDEPGGYCRTIHDNEYVWDYAGHFYHFRTEKYKELFLSLVEENEIVRRKKNTKIFYGGELIDYPFQTNIHELQKEEFIECLCDLYFRDKVDTYNDFLGMLYAKFGKAITDKFLKPYNEKLYATDLRNLDKDAMGRFFPYADFEQVMRSMANDAKETYNDQFMYLKRGTGYFVDKLYGQLDANRVWLNCGAVRLNIHEKFVETSDGRVICYDNLINTIPLNAFLKILDDSELNGLADELSYNKVLVLNLGFDGPSKKYNDEHWVYFPDKSLNFYRVGFYNNILGQNKLSIYVEIGFPKLSTANDINVESELEKALVGLKEVGIIDDEMKLMKKNILLMDPAYVHISTHESQVVDKLFEKLLDDNVYMLGRYGRWTYNCMEDCIQLADELASRLRVDGR